MPKILLFLLFFTVPFQLKPQILPREGSVLNYRLVGFSFPAVQEVKKYTIEIAPGYYNRADSFAQKITVSTDSKDNRIIAEAPYFGSQYTWRVVYNSRKGKVKNSPLYHFSTGTNVRIDTNKLRLRILQPADKQYKDMYSSVDAGGVLYDMKGSPVWYIPDTNGLGGYVLDMQFTPEGTITFIFEKRACEINLNGDILWSAPTHDTVSGDTSGERFHHEFTKLANGHYMALGMQLIFCKQVTTPDTSYIIVCREKNPSLDRLFKENYKRARFGTIIEYDEKGNVAWSWRSSKYLLGSDFDYFTPADSNLKFDPHDNAFFFDQQHKVIYLGFRNLNRIIKIEYPSGKVLATYGERFKPGLPQAGDGLFCNQHSIGRSKEGYLYLFNNNSCNLTDSLPTVVMLEEPVTAKDSFRKVWEYTCTMEGIYPKKFGSGGNVKELEDGSLFVNMGSDYSKLFILDRGKKVFWSALPERYMEPDTKWVPIKEYRASMITRTDMEKLIWNAEASTQAVKVK